MNICWTCCECGCCSWLRAMSDDNAERPKPSRAPEDPLPIRPQECPKPPPRKSGWKAGVFITTSYHLLEGGEGLERKTQPPHLKALPGNPFPWVPFLNPKHPNFPGPPLAGVRSPPPKLQPTPKLRLPRRKDRDRSRSRSRPKPVAAPPKKARPQ